MVSERFTKLFYSWFPELEKVLSEDLIYHNANHTKNVVNACAYLADKEGVVGEEKDCLLAAALFHDSGFTKQYFHNEELGASIAEQTLPNHGFKDEEIELIKHIIESTSLLIHPRNKLEEIIHDADLNYLGRPDYFPRAKNLRTELEGQGQKFDEEQWLNMQLDFLNKFEYLTEAAISLVGEGLKKNRVLVFNKLQSLLKENKSNQAKK